MKKVAFLFPGQGAQKVGMGREFHDTSATARVAFTEADAALGTSLTDLILNGPADQLTLTANTQPAILTVSIAAFRAFREVCDVAPEFVAGHSLGEFSALVAVRAMRFADAVKITRARGMYMQEAVLPGQGAMAAVMGSIEPERIAGICRETAGDEVVAPANFNAPGQVVISGHGAAVKRASEALQAVGAKVIPLSVSAPFHSTLMEPAAVRLGKHLRDIEFFEPSAPVICNVDAEPNEQAARIPDLLRRQVTAPVRWTESMLKMLDAGVELFLEFGPGNVLAGLLKRIDREAKVHSINSPSSLAKAMEALS